MTYEQRIRTIKVWLGRYLDRKAVPRRLQTDESKADELAAMGKALNRAINSDATEALILEWLEKTGERLDLQEHTAWSSIGEMVKALKAIMPQPERVIEPEPEDAGREMAEEWLKSPEGRVACLRGYHVNAAQWIKNRSRIPDRGEMDGIRQAADEVRERVVECAQKTNDGPLAVAIAKSAQAIERRRIAVYERMREYHQLPADPEWRAINVDASV